MIFQLSKKKFIIYTITSFIAVGNMIAFQNCAKQPGFQTADFESKFTNARMCYFDERVLMSGESVIGYQNSSVPFGSRCRYELRTCQNGMLSGSYRYADCREGGAASCLFNGNTIKSGEYITTYLTSSVIKGEACQSERRSCQNGVLSGTYQFAYCIETTQSCMFNGQTIPNGGSVKAYLNSSVKSGSNCANTMETRTCANGVLSGTYQFASCSTEGASGCSFNGQTIASGEAIKAFLNSTEGYGGQCREESRTCQNGVLSGSYQFASCTVGGAASCLFNGVQYPHGAEVTAFELSSVKAGTACKSEVRKCNNGTMSGTYYYPYCREQTASSCQLNGTTITSGQSVIMFKDANVAYGSNCVSESRTCMDGVLTGTYMQPSCQVAEPQTRTLSINTEVIETTPFYKILIVIDNRETMMLAKSRFDNLVNHISNAFKGKNVEVKVVTTAVLGRLRSKKYYPAPESGFIDLKTATEISVDELLKKEVGYKFTEVGYSPAAPGMTFRFSASDPDTITNIMHYNLNTYLKAMSFNETWNSEPYEVIGKEFLNNWVDIQNQFFKKGDRGGVFFISNNNVLTPSIGGYLENKGERYDHTPEYAFFHGELLLYLYDSIDADKVSGVRGEYIKKSSYSLNDLTITDLTEPSTDSMFTYFDICKKELKEKLAIEYFTDNTRYGNYSLDHVGCSWATFRERHTLLPIAKLQNNEINGLLNSHALFSDYPSNTNLCEITNFKGETNVGKYLEKHYGGEYLYFRKCVKRPYQSNLTYNATEFEFKTKFGTIATTYSNLLYSTTNDVLARPADLLDKLIINAKNHFGENNIFFNFYVYPSTANCTLKNGETKAVNIENGIKSHPNNAKIYSLCESADLSSSFTPLSGVKIPTVKTEYLLNDVDRTKVTEVNIIRGGSQIKLVPKDDYDLTSKIGYILIKKPLQAGDQIEVKYY